MLTNGKGPLLAFVITLGKAQDATAEEKLMDLDETNPKAVCADRG